MLTSVKARRGGVSGGVAAHQSLTRVRHAHCWTLAGVGVQTKAHNDGCTCQVHNHTQERQRAAPLAHIRGSTHGGLELLQAIEVIGHVRAQNHLNAHPTKRMYQQCDSSGMNQGHERRRGTCREPGHVPGSANVVIPGTAPTRSHRRSHARVPMCEPANDAQNTTPHVQADVRGAWGLVRLGCANNSRNRPQPGPHLSDAKRRRSVVVLINGDVIVQLGAWMARDDLKVVGHACKSGHRRPHARVKACVPSMSPTRPPSKCGGGVMLTTGSRRRRVRETCAHLGAPRRARKRPSSKRTAPSY